MPAWDIEWLLRINQDWSHPVLDWLMPAFSAINAWIPLFVVLALLVLWRGGRQGRLLLLSLALALGFGDGLFCNTLKKAVGRVRPRDAMPGLSVPDLAPASPSFLRLFYAPVVGQSSDRQEPRGKSFPSSHTVNIFAAATVVALFSRRWGWLAYGIALIVAYSRIYMAAHWPSDVIPSMGMGVLIGLGAVFLVRRFSRSRYAPKLLAEP